MMTPSELKEYEFKSAGRNAYKADDVDLFFGQVLVDYEKMYREYGEINKRMSLLADKIHKYKEDEDSIKQAVLSAQKAADIIVRDAEESVADAKAEAEDILAAAKGEAQIIKADAEKQAIADSDLLLSIARDKAEDILNKAKEQAHSILIAANETANNKVGAATRTITSESLHYDMLKKEVSEFRASILAQYKAHIELISKLPELADEEASKIESEAVSESEVIEDVEKIAEVSIADDYSDSEANVTEDEEVVEYSFDSVSDDAENSDDVPESDSVIDEPFAFDEENEGVMLEENESEDEAPADIPVSKRFSINAEDVAFDGFDSVDVGEEETEPAADVGYFEENDNESGSSEAEASVDYEDEGAEDESSVSSFFESIESIDTEASGESKPKKRFFFRKK